MKWLLIILNIIGAVFMGAALAVLCYDYFVK